MFVNLWVTTKCNMACKYCYEGITKANLFMDTKTANNIIKHIENHVSDEKEKIIVEFHGGEPLINVQVIRYIIDRLNNILPQNSKQYGITTNGVLITEEIAKFITQTMDYNLSISIDGTQESNDIQRKLPNGMGTYSLITDKIELLLRHAPNTTARMTLTPETCGNLYNNCLHLSKMGFKNIGTSMDYFNSDWTEEHFECIGEQIKKLVYYKKKQVEKINFSILNYLSTVKGICCFGKSYFNVYPNGDIYPCTYSVGNSEFILGNINKEGFSNKELISEIREINKKSNPECDGCSHIRNCPSTRCKLINKAITGDFCIPSPVICAYENLKLYIEQICNEN